MITIGLDIGYDRCGFAVVETNGELILESGIIVTDKSLPINRRLNVLRNDLEFIKKKYSPVAVCIEKLFFYRKNRVFEKICMSKGVALELFCESLIIEIEPKKAKKEIVGHGDATKNDIKKLLGLLLSIDFTEHMDDEVDAIYLGLYSARYLLSKNLQI